MNPISEQIVQEVIARLETITTSNGYAFSVNEVTTVDEDGQNWSPKNRDIGVSTPIESRQPENDKEGNPPAIAWQLTFNLHCFVANSNKTATPEDNKTERQLASAAHKAIATPDQWQTFGGLAYDAEFGEVTPFVGEGEQAGTTAVLLVRYRVAENDPEQNRA